MGDERQDIGVLLSLAQVTFSEELREHLRASGHGAFTTRTGFVLRLLATGPLSLRGLADRLHMTPQATLKLVDAMADAGYVDRTGSPSDGRVRLVAVSERGRAALAVAQAFHDRFEADLASEIGADAAGGVRRGLELLAARTPVVVPGGSSRSSR